MGTRVTGILVLAVVLVAPYLGAAADETDLVTITLKDGGTLVGRVVAEDESAVTLRTSSGVELTLPKQAIASRETPTAKSELRSTSPVTDPNESRLMFAPTGRPLGKGNGYFSDHYVVFPGFAFGLTKNLSLSGGVSTIPALGLSEQVFYVSTSAAWTLGDEAAVGGFVAGGPSDDGADSWRSSPSENGRTIFGPRGEYLSSDTSWRFRDVPVVMVGGSLRVARNLSLISESWLFPGTDFELSQQPFGLALRFFNGRLSADVGVVLVAEVLEEGFPVPWLSFSYHFGPSRKASSRNAGALPPAAVRAARGGR